MIRYVSEKQQAVPSHLWSWLRVWLRAGAVVVLSIALAMASMSALLAPYLNDLLTRTPAHDTVFLACGGLALPC